MALVEGKCSCNTDGCRFHKDEDPQQWVDVITRKCRDCEIGHGERWGHRDVKAEPGKQ